jgi:RNA 2',3'-cyclic 3'-phosphodiesterase
MARAFVAVRPPGGVLAAVASAVASAEGSVTGARWTRNEQWHLTLQFLGNQADLDAVAGGLGALALRPGQLQVGGWGAFPSERRARVLWLGVVEGAEYLAQLAAAVGALLAPLGHEPEDRGYHAHLTLARLARPADLRAAVAALPADPVGAPFTAEEVLLYESTTRREGAEYRVHARFPLGD